MKTAYAKVLILSIIFSATALGQSMRFGIHATPSFNWVRSSDEMASSDLDLKFGFGLLIEYEFADRYSLAMGLDILGRGGVMNLRDTSADYHSGFVQLPIAIKMRTKEFGYMTYFARFGGALGIETSEKVSFDPDIPEQSRIDSYVRPLAFNFLIAAGAEYSLGGRSALMVEVNYNSALVNNLNNDDDRLSSGETYRFDYIGITFGVLF